MQQHKEKNKPQMTHHLFLHNQQTHHQQVEEQQLLHQMFYGLHPPQDNHQQLFYAMGTPEEPSLETPRPNKRSSLAHPQGQNKKNVSFGAKMEDTQPPKTCPKPGPSKRSVDGEIVEVEGGHIIRSTGRKDRHSKVCTARGPRDRRVRLAAHTAIQFYDVQDRLGYDRPSKAVDWLMTQAKSAIDELEHLPHWEPTATTNAVKVAQPAVPAQEVVNHTARPMEVEQDNSGYGFHHQHFNTNNHGINSGFLPPSLDSDAIADTIKSFFPIAAGASGVGATSSSPVHFHNYQPDLLPRGNSHTQDLRLSLQSLHDPILFQHQSHHHSNPTQSSQQSIFSCSSPLHFDAAASTSWSDQPPPPQHHHEMGRFQRMLAWNDAGADPGSEEGGFSFTSTHPQPSLGLNPSFFPQRGPLQSTSSPQFRAWTDQSFALMNHSQMQSFNQSPVSGFGFASGGFPGFCIPARIQGEEEHDDAASDKPPSASRH